MALSPLHPIATSVGAPVKAGSYGSIWKEKSKFCLSGDFYTASAAAVGGILHARSRKKAVSMRSIPARINLETQLSEFQEQLVQAWEGFHVHVGAGKIGLGLILPAIVRRGRNFVILQRPSGKWKSLLKHDIVTISVNGKHVTKLRIVSNMEQLDQATASALGESYSSSSFMSEINDVDMDIFSEGILVISDDPNMFCALVDKAASFSISVGGSYLAEAMQPIKDAVEANRKRDFDLSHAALESADLERAIKVSASAAASAAQAAGNAFQVAAAVARTAGISPPRSLVSGPPPIYCCENDHEAIQNLEATFSGLLSLVPVLVDRVCSRVVFTDGGIEVTTESYPGDIVLPVGNTGAQLPFAGANVHQPSTDLGSQFLHEKKLLTVNGTHTTLAFLTLIQAEPETHGPPKASHELLQYNVDAITSGDVDTVGRDLWVWAIARQVLLLSEFHEEVARHTMKKTSTFGKLKWAKLASDSSERYALIQSLLNFAQTSLIRLSHGGDETGRVLGGGVDNRYQTRLANVLDFFRQHQLLELPEVAQELLVHAKVSEAELRSRLERVVREASRFVSDPTTSAEAVTSERWGLTPRRTMEMVGDVEKQINSDKSVAVLFDFDGTLGDTETPAMEVAFWTIAPYLPQLSSSTMPQLLQACGPYIQENAGKAFEHMIEKCDEERSSKGMTSIEETRTSGSEDPSLLANVDKQRAALGLPTIASMRQQHTEPKTLLEQQKLDTVTRLRVATHPCPGVVEVLGTLESMETAFVIATTSGKPRVPVCVDASGLRHFFPSNDDSIHSGESDFQPPRFKPDPDVYLKAAASVGIKPKNCVAVEDSASGVGSAANAGIGLIVGYVGGSHIGAENKESHARMLLAGTRSKDGRGADMVLSHMFDLPLVVEHFQEMRKAGKSKKQFPSIRLESAAGRVFFPDN